MLDQLNEKLHKKLDEFHLLKHPFYESWNSGNLSIEILKTYASEYYSHVEAFPRYISAVHSNCENIDARRVLLANLNDEEDLKNNGKENHPKLWRDFAYGLGVNSIESPKIKETKELVDGYFELTKKDYETGLGAIYAYERQTPEVSKSKIDGLVAHYGINDESTLKFFKVHMVADEWHREEVENLINKCDNKEKIEFGAIQGAKLLWGFLDGMYNQMSCNL